MRESEENQNESVRMSGMDKGRILLSVTGFNPQRWYELLSASRTVTLEPDGPADPTITYAVVWKHRPNLLSTLPNLRAIFSIWAMMFCVRSTEAASAS